MIVLGALITAIIPVIFWYFIIIRSHRKGMKFFFFLIFILSALFAFFWKTYAEDYVLTQTKLFVGVLLSFIIAGTIIEYGKNFIVRLIGKNYFHGIDDVVDLSFATALGFTCMENWIEFYILFEAPFDYGSPVSIIKEILKKEFFILPIHLFCSGIFGYYYGVSLFATNEDGEICNDKWFNTKQIMKGTLISTITYGVFFMLKELDPGLQDVAQLFGFTNFLFGINEKLLPIISFGFFSAGSLFLFHLMEQKHYLIHKKKIKLHEDST